MRVRYADPEQSEVAHSNPDPLARHADISVNGAAPRRVLFPHGFHANNFWELTVPVELRKGRTRYGSRRGNCRTSTARRTRRTPSPGSCRAPAMPPYCERR